MKKTQLSLLLGIGLLSAVGLGVSQAPTSTISNTKNIKLLNNHTQNAQYACVINGNGALTLTNGSGKTIGYVSVGEMLTLGQSSNNKTFVTVHETGMQGYLSNANIQDITSGVGQNLINLNEKGFVINVSTTVHVRANATMNSQVLTNLVNNTTLSIIGKQGNWFKVNVNGVTGYIFKEYISTNTVDSSNLLPPTNNPVKTSIQKSTKSAPKTTKITSSDQQHNNAVTSPVKPKNQPQKPQPQKPQPQTTQTSNKKNNVNITQPFNSNGIIKKLGTGYDHAKLHSAPSSSSSGYDLSPGTPVKILGKSQGFYHVELPNGTTGYVYAPFVANN